MDMRFYWIRDRVRQGQFLVYWRKGKMNKGDYFSKDHPTSHHRDIRSSYLHMPNARSRNYFECLQDADTIETPPSARSVTFADNVAKSASSEGVLIPTSPKVTRTSEPASQNAHHSTHNLRSSPF
jgi:hypothetical protein